MTQCPMTNDGEKSRKPPRRPLRYDLGRRTAAFAKDVIHFLRTLRVDAVSRPLIIQCVRAAASIGANYAEADEAESPKDFRHKVCLCRKEAKETLYWLELLATAAPAHRDPAAVLWTEAKALHLIFCRIIHTCDCKPPNP